MSRTSRMLQVGAKVTTDFSGRLTEHEIIERAENVNSTSRIGFHVRPPVPKSTGGWLDADWFEPAPGRQDEKGKKA
jgi:hypothetical protein